MCMNTNAILNVKGEIIITLYQLCHLADEYKQKRGITIVSKRLAWEDRKEEREELGGMIFISPPLFFMTQIDQD